MAEPSIKSPILEDFAIGKFLGRGKYGTVYLARHIPSNMVVALKILYKSYILKERCEGQIRRELDIHQNLLHVNCCRLYSWFEDDKRIVLVLEYCPGGTLYDYLQKVDRIEAPACKLIAKELVRAINYLHQKSIAHRDIKLENVLLGYSPEFIRQQSLELSQSQPLLAPKLPDFVFKLSDFGWSVHEPQIANKSAFQESRRRTQCGTLDYLPPQILASQQYSAKVDIWALGVLIYELHQGKPPFYDDDVVVTKKKILEAKCNFDVLADEEMRDFIKKCLVKDEAKRAGADELTKHRWLMVSK